MKLPVLDVYIIKQGKYVVSYCQAIEFSSYGITETDAKRGFLSLLKLISPNGISKAEINWIHKKT